MNRSFLLSATVATTLALAVICGAAGAKPAYGATTITVNTTSDEAVTDGQCSLREAISNANANSDTTAGDCAPGNPGADTIDLSSLNGAISLAFDLDGISDDLTIAQVLTHSRSMPTVPGKCSVSFPRRRRSAG